VDVEASRSEDLRELGTSPSWLQHQRTGTSGGTSHCPFSDV
jgi:hypothetical protein